MDVLTSMLAYLGCITGIVGALALSFAIFVAPLNQPVIAKHAVAMTARQSSVAKAATAPPATAAAKLERHAPAVSTVAQSTTASQTAVAASARQKVQSARTQYYRRVVQEERAKRWAYRQDPDFEARFLGYAD